MLKGFAYHGLTVSDLYRSVAFYRDLLNMRLERTYACGGKAFAEATGLPEAHAKVAVLSVTDRLGIHFLKLSQYSSPKGKSRYKTPLCDMGASHIALTTEQLQETYEDLLGRGVKFVHAPVRPNPTRPGMFTYMFDPDGVSIELGRVAHHHAHVVSDLDKAHDFSVELHQYIHPQGKKTLDLRLCDVGCSSVGLAVDDVRKAYHEYQSRGGKFVSPPVELDEAGTKVTVVNMLDQGSYVIQLRPAGAPV